MLRAPRDEPGRHQELPPGLADVLPGAAQKLFALRGSLQDALGRWGYRPVLTPLVEYADVFTRAWPEAGDEVSLHRLLDRATGHVLALRPDFTPQVARLAASRLRDSALPLRLCYEGPVVRHVPAQKGRSRQIYQVGGEILGAVGPEADAEAIAVVIDCLKGAGVEAFRVDVGQVEFFKGVLSGVDLPHETGEALKACVARKDFSDLAKLLDGTALPDAKKRLLAEIPLLAGGVEVLDRAARLVESDHSRQALENLGAVVGRLAALGLGEYLTVDLGELRGIDYHSGVVFEAFVHHVSVPLCKGGRYDDLLGRYGWNLPATGFTFDLVALLEAVKLQAARGRGPEPSAAWVIDRTEGRTAGARLAAELRGGGRTSACELLSRPVDESVRCAREQGFAWAVVLGGPESGSGNALLVNLATGAAETVPADQACRRMAGKE